MYSRSKYVLAVVVVTLVLLWVTPSPVHASIAQPTTLDIQEVIAYENAGTTGVQLYLVTYFIEFETNPDENADDLFIFRLLDATDEEIASELPFPYYDQGYGLGVVAFYFDLDEAPTWEGSYTMEIIGNPLADWTGDPPQTTTNSITWLTDTVSDMQELISGKIISLATELEQSWSVEMTETYQSTTILSDTGSAYFLRVLPNLQSVAPYVLGQYVFDPQYPTEKPGEATYPDELITGIEGTIFDVSDPAENIGLSQGIVVASIYYVFFMVLVILLISKNKMKKGTMLFLWPVVIGGAFIGVPFYITIGGGFFAIVATAWVFYSKSPS